MANFKKISSILIPGFLKRADRWLLENYPFLWRSKLPHAFLYIFLIGNLLVCLGVFFALNDSVVGYLNDTAFYSLKESDIFSWFSFSLLFLLFPLTYWIIVQVRWNTSEFSFRNIFKKGILSGFVISILYLNSVVFISAVISKVSNIINDEHFYSEFEFHEKNHFWDTTMLGELYLEDLPDRWRNFIGSSKYKIVEGQFRELQRHFMQIGELKVEMPLEFIAQLRNEVLKKYFNVSDIESPFSSSQLDKVRALIDTEPNLMDTLKSIINQENTIRKKIDSLANDLDKVWGVTLSFPRSSGWVSNLKTNGTEVLKKEFNSIKAAKEFKNRKGPYFDRYIKTLPTGILLCFGLGFFIQIFLGYHNFRLFFRIKSIKDYSFPKDNLWKPRFINKLNKYLLREYPLIWSTKVHFYLYDTLVYLILIPIVLFKIVTFFFQPYWLTVNSISDLQNSGTALSGIIIYSLLLPLGWLYRQGRDRKLSMNIKSQIILFSLTTIVISTGFIFLLITWPSFGIFFITFFIVILYNSFWFVGELLNKQQFFVFFIIAMVSGFGLMNMANIADSTFPPSSIIFWSLISFTYLSSFKFWPSIYPSFVFSFYGIMTLSFLPAWLLLLAPEFDPSATQSINWFVSALLVQFIFSYSLVKRMREYKAYIS